MRSDPLSEATKDFSLVSEAPVYLLLLRGGLVKPPSDRVAWRMTVITVVAWVRLLLLAVLGGRIGRIGPPPATSAGGRSAAAQSGCCKSRRRD